MLEAVLQILSRVVQLLQRADCVLGLNLRRTCYEVGVRACARDREKIVQDLSLASSHARMLRKNEDT